MKRRAFIAVLGGAAASPLMARAQLTERLRRIGVLIGLAEDDPETKARLVGFRQGLEKRGWSEGHNVRIDYRFAPAGAQVQVLAKELVALQPDAIFANSTLMVTALQRESSTMPIVFAGVADPIGSGFVASLPRPGGNITGVMQARNSLSRFSFTHIAATAATELIEALRQWRHDRLSTFVYMNMFNTDELRSS